MDAPQEELIEERKPASLLVAQFFLFPLIIIAICIGVFLLFGYVSYVPRTPRENLRELQSGSESQRWSAAVELSKQVSTPDERAKHDPDFVDDVIKAYQGAKKDDPRIRRYLALTIGQIGDKRGIDPLLEALDDADVDIQKSALWALGKIGDNSAVPGVTKQLKHSDPSVRREAAIVLGLIKDPSSSHDLQVALNDVKDEVRWYAAIALANMNDSSGAELLVRLLGSDYVDSIADVTPEEKIAVRLKAVRYLALLKFEPAREKIVALSKDDPNLKVRSEALEALKIF